MRQECSLVGCHVLFCPLRNPKIHYLVYMSSHWPHTVAANKARSSVESRQDSEHSLGSDHFRGLGVDEAIIMLGWEDS
jgi:hypothetical protein